MHAGHEKSAVEKGAEYESLVRALVDVLQGHRDLQNYMLGSGNKNRIKGKSGYWHQIDLCLETDETLFILELKNYRQPIGVDAVLVIAARRLDIAAARPDMKVHASLVSTQRVTVGAKRLADHFEVEIDVVKDMMDYGLKFSARHFHGVFEKPRVCDEYSVRVINPFGEEVHEPP